MYIPLYSDIKRQRELDARNETINSFTVKRIDGVDYILHLGTVVSRSTDGDILDRLNELRSIALSSSKPIFNF